MSLIKSYLHQKMTDKIIDRDALQDTYINEIIDGMDMKDLIRIVYDNLESNLDKLFC